MLVTPANGIVLQARSAAGGITSILSQMPDVTAPYWVRLTRTGNSFTGYASSDGTSWTSFGSVTIPMAATTYLGLPATSHNNANLGAALFNNIQITP
jgi:regulation of enolase protein 1 (concanavalin A-like superfamily)